jgi:antitoxin MazE
MNASFAKTQLQSTLRKMGNSTGMILPKAILTQLGLASGAKVELRVEDGEIVARPVKRRVREGWEEAAKRIGAAGMTDQEREWLDMPSAFDSKWEW